MRNLIFTNYQASFTKEYKTDKIGSNHVFTVQDIKISGNVTDEAAIRAGLNMERLPYSIEEFKAKATALNLTLKEHDASANTITELISEAGHMEITTSSLDAGIVGTAEKTVVSVPATSGVTQGDYFIINTKSGISYAIWLDKDAAGIVPNGPIFLATHYQIRVGVVTGGTAAQNAALLKAALVASLTWSGFGTIVDNSDGTLDFTASDLGNTVNATRHNEAESGNGSFTLTITPGTGDYSKQIVSEGGVLPHSFELDSTSDDLPAGFTLSSTGLLSGVTDEDGEYELVIKATDVFGQTVLSDTLTLTIAE